MSEARWFIAVSALLLAVSAAVTVIWCASMSAMGGMPMPGGWTMSMGVDADAGPIVARRGRDVPRHVDSDDGSNDAAVARPDAVALSSDVRLRQATCDSVG
jgi:hypothetical protein